jgi:haloalkane dehalogenase
MRIEVTDGPFAEKKFIEIKGRKMAYIDEGEGAPIVFQHGNPSSSYIWRKIMPACVGLGRLIACDLIGMGDSQKLPDSGPHRYTYKEQREFLFALWEELGLDRDVTLVVHDWGAVLGFDWARNNPGRVKGIVHMEAAPVPLVSSDLPGDEARQIFGALRSEAGDELVLTQNAFVEMFLIGAENSRLTEADKAEYRRPFLNAGEDRRPTLTWPRQIPLEGTPADVAKTVSDNYAWLEKSSIPKLWIKGDPGFIVSQERFLGLWGRVPNQTQITVNGQHFVQESSAPEISKAVADFIRHV